MKSLSCRSVRLPVSPTNTFWNMKVVFHEILRGRRAIKGDIDAVFLCNSFNHSKMEDIKEAGAKPAHVNVGKGH